MSFASVALLVDGDNISSAFAGRILRKAGDLGPLRVRRVYGNAANRGGWGQAPSFRVMDAGAGKNGADLLLAIDAMELALTTDTEAFVIVSSDRDFSHLAHRLREMGQHVLGLGEEGKAPPHFMQACSSWLYIKRPETADAEKDLPELDRDVMAVIRSMDTTGSGALLQNFNAQMRRHRPLFKISEQPEKTWPGYFKAREGIYRVNGTGQEKRVSVALRNAEG